MGLFDYVRCKYPLPVEGANDIEFHTKDTDWPYLDHWEVREDGTLWVQRYDIEDRSDKSAPVGSMKRLVGMMTRINERWEQHSMTGELVISGSVDDKDVSFSLYFVRGQLKHLENISEEPQ